MSLQHALHSGFDRRLSKGRMDRSLLLFLVLQTALIVGWIVVGEIVYLPVVITVVALAFVASTSLSVAIPLIILAHALVFVQRTEGISIAEVGFAFLFFGVITVWMFDRLLVERQSLLVDAGDRPLILFLALAASSLALAIGFESNILLWLRELLVFLSFLLFFPLRDLMREKRGRRIVYAALLLLALAISVKNLIQYRSGLMLATYLWEVLRSRQTANEPLTMTILVGSIAVFMASGRRMIRIAALMIAAFFALALLVTFSRGYWLGAALAVLVMFILGTRTERVRILQLGITLGLVVSAVMAVLFSDVVIALFLSVFGRFVSAATATTDISVANRLIETQVVWDLILKNPLIGYGLGAKYSYYHLLRTVTHDTEYVHNAYLYLWFKLGLPGLVIFLVMYLSKIRDGLRVAWTNQVDKSLRPFLVAAVAILVAMLQISVTSPQFYARDSILIITICWATISAAQVRDGRTKGGGCSRDV
ncbi:MAG: O-antigen ligase family protein [Ignavibacteria bacterium]|nr:O-antigen ligase family protein [Ignavibacteria bacterium]